MGRDMRQGAFNIAVVGMGAILPGASDKGMFWKNILDGKDCIIEVPSSHWLIEDYCEEANGREDKIHCKKGAFLPEMDFDPVEFGLPPKLLKSTDIIQLLALLAAKQVIKDTVSLTEDKLDRDKISVILGASGSTQLTGQMVAKVQKPVWIKAMREHGLEESKAEAVCDRIFNSYPDWDENTFPGYLNNIIAGRIANRFNFRGMNCCVDAACGSSLGALNMAVNELLLGRSELVITGGCDATSDIASFFSFERSHALSKTGDCRPFSEDADGTVLGEGIAMLALRRLKDARRDGDKIYALIQGIGCSSDGKAKSIYAPSSDGQALAIRKAYEHTGYPMSEVELIEAHGTGTLAGDRVEFSGLAKAYDGDPDKMLRHCAIGSVKSQIGHTKGAAGAAGLLKAIMALQHKVLPGTIKVARPNSRIKIEQSPFYINTATRPWIHEEKSTRKAGVSAFGFGGSNYHVAVEEYAGGPEKPLKIRHWPVELFLVSGKDAAEIRAGIHGLKSLLLEKSLSRAARTTRESFRASAPRRLAMLAKDADAALELCRQVLDKINEAEDEEISIPDRLYYFIGERRGKIACVFPGQGSQYVNMGSDMAVAFDEVRRVWDRTCVLDFREGISLSQVVFPVPAFEEAGRKKQQELLTKTQWAQPAIGAMSTALLELLKRLGLKPDFAAGHSFGEVTALYAAGTIPEAEDFIRISRKRGELMAEAASSLSGAMTAVFAGSELVEKILKESGTRVCIANYNSPSQVVISGDMAEIDAIEKRLGRRGMPFKRLPVAAAFHSKHVAGSKEPFYEYLKTKGFQAPEFGVLSNTSGELYPHEPEVIREILSEQLTRPVRFREQIENLYQKDVRIFVEVGPGSVMSKLITECLADRAHYAVPLDQKGKNGVASFLNALALLSAAGVELSFEALWKDFSWEEAPSRQLSPVSVKINGALYGKKYPPEGGFDSLPKPNTAIEAGEPEKSSPVIGGFSPGFENTAGCEKYAREERTTDMCANSQDNTALLAAFMQIQKSAAAAEETFQKTITESHMAYIKAVEETVRQIGSLGGAVNAGGIGAVQNRPTLAPPVAAIREIVQESPSMGTPGNAFSRTEPDAAAAVMGEAVAAPAMEGRNMPDIKAVLLEVVSEKTGYPSEMLRLDMDLEADLGIDSIKKIEILAALKEQMPGYAEEDISGVAAFKTLGEILEHLSHPADSRPLTPEKSEGESRQESSAPGIGRYLLASRESPAVLQPVAQLPGSETIFITKDKRGIAEALAQCFQEIQAKTEIVERIPEEAGALIYLKGLELPPDSDFDTCCAMTREVFALARLCGKNLSCKEGLFVVVQDTGGKAGLDNQAGSASWASGLSALAKTCAKEWSRSRVKAISIDSRAMSAPQIAKELFKEIVYGGKEIEVGIPSPEKRITPELVREEKPGGTAHPLKENDLLVVSGGARGIVAHCLLELSKKHKLRLALLGRTELTEEPEGLDACRTDAELKKAIFESEAREGLKTPLEVALKAEAILAAREIRENISRLEANGAAVEYYPADIRNLQEVGEVVEQIRRKQGGIKGIIHGAGILADKFIHEKTDEQFKKVFETKVHGFYHLLEATKTDELTHICCFTSMAARFGNPGQADYAMANEILNKVCRAESARRGEKCLVKAINWGPWDGGMVTPFLRRQLENEGIAMITLPEGAVKFAEEMGYRDENAIEVVIGGIRKQ